MTPLRAKKDRQWGESIVFQCHNMGAKNKICLLVQTVTTSVPFFMRTGDFSDSQFDWKSVAPQTIPEDKANELHIGTEKVAFVLPQEAPPSPWIRETATKIVWDSFWTAILKNGEIAVDALRLALFDKKGKSPKTEKLIEQVPEWITGHSGYSVVKQGSSFKVVGKTMGNNKLFPYSDPKYRKAHGL